jgi:arylsulfatase A-like enzyme
MLKQLLSVLLLTVPGLALADDRPNIILFYADDLDFDEVPRYEQLDMPCLTAVRASKDATVEPQKLHMPNLERLSQEGALFTNFYVTSPICTPSRYSILTGRYASRSPGFCERQPPGTLANIQWNTPLAPAETNIAKALKSCGYVTGFVGKWHNQLPGGAVRGISVDMDPTDPRVAKAALEAQKRRSRYLREQIGFDYAARIYDGNKEAENIPADLRVHNLAWLAEGAVEFIRQNREQPFFLYLPVTVPHSHFNPRLIKESPLATIVGMLDREPDVMPPKATVAQRAKAAGVPPRNFAGTWLDDCVGAVMHSLDELDLTKNTVFVFVSDHQSRGKYTCYEGARVPMIVRWPGRIPAGTVNDTLAANIDLPATLIDIAGGDAPNDMTTDGRSLSDAWTKGSEPDSWRAALLLECSSVRAVVTHRWKYLACRPVPKVMAKMSADAEAARREGRDRLVDWSGNANPHPRGRKGGIRYNADLHFPAYFDADQLYDLRNDVIEQKNVAKVPKNATTVAELQQHLRDLLRPLPHTFGEFKTE